MSLSQTKEPRQVTKQSDLNSIRCDNKNQTCFFFALPVSESVDFDQTTHFQEQSDLCLHPFLKPINPFGIFFDVKCKRPESTLCFFPPKSHVDSMI